MNETFTKSCQLSFKGRTKFQFSFILQSQRRDLAGVVEESWELLVLVRDAAVPVEARLRLEIADLRRLVH